MDKEDLIEEYKFFEQGISSALYIVQTGEIFRVFDDNLRKKFNQVLNQKVEDIETINTLKTLGMKKDKSIIEENDTTLINDKQIVLNKLSIVLTNQCNLRCKYCYANYGEYNYKDKINREITFTDLDEIIDYFALNFKSIKVIQFFGGEPTLTSDKIIYVINKFNYMKQKSLIEDMPRFGMVTNGIKFPLDLVKMFSQYNSSITLSIDGPEDINDELRIDVSNSGSFKKIKDTYLLLYNNGIRQIGIESTYTNKHIEKNISLVSLVKFFKKEFNCNIPHIVPIGIEDDNSLSISKNLDIMLEYIEELVEYTFENILSNKELNTISILVGMIRRISLQNTYSKICPAGISTFSVAADKKIQPCFMYTSDEGISLGNIYTSASDIINKSIEFDNKINKKKNVKACKNCFIRNICSSCLGNFRIDEMGVFPKSMVYCEILRHMTQSVILKLVDIKSDPSKWRNLLSVLNDN